jgi:hypothetical protein
VMGVVALGGVGGLALAGAGSASDGTFSEFPCAPALCLGGAMELASQSQSISCWADLPAVPTPNSSSVQIPGILASVVEARALTYALFGDPIR